MQLPPKALRCAKIDPALRLLLIALFCVEVLCCGGLIISNPGISGYSGSAAIVVMSGVGSEITTLKRVWTTALVVAFIRGSGSGSGSVSTLLGILCIAFQVTNSMSLPPPKNLDNLFKSRIPHGSLPSPSPPRREEKEGKSSQNKRSRSMRNIFAYDSGDSRAEYRIKSKHAVDDLPLSSIIPDIYSSDMARTKDGEGSPSLNSILQSLYSNLGRMEKNYILKWRKKSNRRGKNANALQALLAGGSREGGGSSGGSGGGSGMMKNNPYMNKDEEEALRRTVLEKVEELDPLMCLPKVLCGYSSRRRKKQNKNRYSMKSKTTTTTPSSFGKGYLDDYLELLKIVGPSTESQPNPSQKGKKKGFQKSKKSSKPSKKVANEKRKKKTNSKWYLKPDEEEEEEDDILQSRSGSSSSESNESEEPLYPPTTHYERYPVRKRHREKSELGKFLLGKKKKKGKDDDDDDDDDEDEHDETFEDDNEVEDDILDEKQWDDEDVEYLIERAKMQKMMATSGAYSNENWWAPFEETVETNEIYKYPYLLPPSSPQPVYDPLAYEPLPNDDTTSEGGGMVRWVSNVMSNIMPSMTWGGAGSSNDAFKNDPFFASFNSRSLGRKKWDWRVRMDRSFSNKTGNSSISTSTPIPKTQRGKVELKRRSGRKLDPELAKLFAMELQRREADSTGETSGDPDPAAKFRIAVEIGRRLTTPSQCDFIYNGCPLSYEEILVIINEPMKEAAQASQTSTTTTPQPKRTQRPNNKLYNSPVSFPYSGGQNYLTIAPPQVISLPYYSSSPHQSPSYPNHQHHQLSPHYQSQTHQQFQPQQYYHQHPQQFQSHYQQTAYEQNNNLDQFMSQVGAGGRPIWNGGGPSKPHKTSIHQALPSGEEVEINLSYSDKLRQANINTLDRTGLTATSAENDSDEGAVVCKEIEASASPLLDLEDQSTDSVSQKVSGSVSNANYEFNGSSSLYKIHQKKEQGHRDPIKEAYDDEDELHLGVKIANNKVVKINPSTKESSSVEDSNSLQSGPFSQPPKIYSLEADIGMGQSTRNKSHSPPTRTPIPPPFTKKMKKKSSQNKLNKYKEMLKDAFSLSANVPPSRPPPTKISPMLSSLANTLNKLRRKNEWKKPPKVQLPQKKKKEVKLKSKKSPTKIKTSSKKRGKDSKQRNDNEAEDDSSNDSSLNNSSGSNGGSNSESSSDTSASTSNEEKIPKKKKYNRSRLNLTKTRRNPPHLHEQSPKKKRRKGVKKRTHPPAHNPIYPVYGHPFPPPYGGNYYHPHHPPHPPPRPPPPTSGSIFSYFFGR